MVSRKPILAGIDPGTTAAYALGQLDGHDLKVSDVCSGKNLAPDSMVALLSDAGLVVVIATDKRKAPQKIHRIATKLGAYLFSPRYDLKVEDKRLLAEKHDPANSHERDALGALLHAYGKLKPLLMTAMKEIESSGQRKHTAEIIRRMLKSEDLDVKAAISTVRLSRKKKIVPTARKKHEQPDLSDRITELKRTLNKAEKYNEQLKREIAHLKDGRPVPKTVVRKVASHGKNRTISALKDTREKLKRELDEIRQEHKALLNAFDSDTAVLKKVDNLGWKHFDNRRKRLSIGEKDILLVRNPSIISEKTKEHLRKNGPRIVALKGKVPEWMKEKFTILEADNLKGKELNNLRLVDKAELKKELGSQDVIGRVVGQYRKGRKSS